MRLPKKHWILKKLYYLRQEARRINFSSGTTRRRKDLIELLSVINDAFRSLPWHHNFRLATADNGATAKIILQPKGVFFENDGKIILEFPSFHNTHRMVFIFAETEKGMEAAKKLKEILCLRTRAFEFPLILKQGRKLIPIDPA